MRFRSAFAALAAALLLGVLAGTAEAQTITIQTSYLPNPKAVPNWTKGQPYPPTTLFPVGGSPPYTFSVSAGSLPPGLTLTSPLNLTGLLSGTPTATGTYNFTVSVVGLVGTGSASYTVVVAAPPVIDQTSVPKGRVGRDYATTLTVTGGTKPFGFAVTSGSLPPGLTLGNLTGAITGRPTTAGSYSFSVTVTDAALATASRAYVLTVTDVPTLTVSGTTIWTVDRPGFSLTVTASGGEKPLTWDDPTGIPAGLSWSRTGDVLTLSGTPTEVGETTFSVTVRDALDGEATSDTVVKINPPPSIPTTALPDATVLVEYAGPVEVSGGAPPYSWRLLSADAEWVGIDADTGAVTGTPDAVGEVHVTVEVTDATGLTAESGSISLTVNPSPALEDEPLPIGVLDVPYTASLSITGGSGPFTAVLASGTLPEGLELAGTRIAGTPTESGTFEFSVRITDRWGATAARDYRLVVARPVAVNGKLPVTLIPPGGRTAFAFDVLQDTVITVKLRLQGGTAPLNWRLVFSDGTPIDIASYTRLTKKTLTLKKVPVPRSGRVVLILSTLREFGLGVSGKISGRASKGFKRVSGFGPGSGVLEYRFAALAGATVTVAAKSKGKDVPAAELVEIRGPSGSALDTGPFTKTTRTGVKIVKLPAEEAGEYVLRIRPGPLGAAEGKVTVQVKIKSPKVYAFTWTP